MVYKNQEFRPYDNNYYVSKYGEIFSNYKNGLLKHYIDHDGYHRVDIHGKHIKIHKMVYLTWVGDIPVGYQINHRDDNKNNNCVNNLYVGTQKENIQDCIKNGTRKGNIRPITVFDKKREKIVAFPTIKDFIKYTGHSISNGSLSHIIDKKWFKKRFIII